jgi:hypothetical protein
MELRPSLQLSEKVVAVGFAGETVPDPFCTGAGVEGLRGVVAQMEGRAGADALVVDLRNVREITAPGIYSLKSLREGEVVLVVRGEAERQWLAGTGVTDHMRVVIGEEGLRKWLAQKAEDEVTFSEENVRKMIADNITLDAVIARLDRARAEK